MEITIPTELQQYAEQQVAAGEYPSVDAMVSSLLREKQEQREIDEETGLPIAELKRMIAHSHAQIERGEYTEVSREGLKDFFESIKIEGRRRLEAEQAAKK